MAKKKSRADSSERRAVIPNQVFLGLPWRNVRPKYEQCIEKLRHKFPLSFVIVGREGIQDAEDLFDVIKDAILASTYAIFDATGGNANVSLEFGYAEALDVDRILYLSTHAAAKKASKDAPIIADLAGKRRNPYTTQEKLLDLLTAFAERHAYTIKFERFLAKSSRFARRGAKRRARAFALKIIHSVAQFKPCRRTDVVHALRADYERIEIDDMMRRLKSHGLIRTREGPNSNVFIA